MTSSKKCFKCGIEKDLDNFCKTSSAADGHTNECKECHNRRSREDYQGRSVERLSKRLRKERIRQGQSIRTHKVCISCGEDKQLTEFYRHPSTIDGHSNNCKKCYLEQTNEYRRINPESANKSYAKYRKENPEKYKAHERVNSAKRSGELISKPCVKCGSIHHIYGHHIDYSDPLNVIWLCPKCHREEHEKLKENMLRSEEAN